MQANLEMPTVDAPAVSQEQAQRAANTYVRAQIDPTFEVVKGFLWVRKDPRWRFVIRSPHGPLGYLLVEAETGRVIPLTEDEKRIVQERALIAAAESRNERPVVAQGYVPAEYARRRGNGYLTEQLGLHYSAIDGCFVTQDQPVWQFAIRFRLPRRDVAGVMGTLSVDAPTGEPLPLTAEQLNHIRDQTHALIGS